MSDARTSFDWFIYTRESMKCLYIQWVAYKYAISKECLWIKSRVLRENKRFGNRLKGPWKQYTSFPLVGLKYCCLRGTFRKHTQFAIFFVSTIDENPAIFPTWSLAHSQNWRMLIKFFRSEYIGRKKRTAYIERLTFDNEITVCTLPFR